MASQGRRSHQADCRHTGRHPAPSCPDARARAPEAGMSPNGHGCAPVCSAVLPCVLLFSGLFCRAPACSLGSAKLLRAKVKVKAGDFKAE
eukprot:1510874-Pyramimonas_sp.AAC.1